MIDYQHDHNTDPRLEQMVLLCQACGAVLITIGAQQRGVCSTCVYRPPQAEPQPVSRPKLTTTRAYMPRKRRRYPPDWFYEVSLDEVMQLINLFRNSLGSPPLSAPSSDDRRRARELQDIYARAAEHYFAANTPYGINRDGLLRWFTERLRDHQQRFRS